MIHGPQGARVFETLGSLLDELAANPEHHALHAQALAIARHEAERGEVFLPIDVPLAVADLLDAPADERLAAAAAGTLLWAGADLLDDAADGELTPAWAGVPRGQIELVAINLLATLPHLAVQRLAPAAWNEGAAARVAPEIARALWRMSEGQHTDLAGASAVGSVADYVGVIVGKTGAEVGCFAALPPLLRGLPEETVERWRTFGVRLGCMVQAFSDTASSVAGPDASDLRLGKRSLPVLHCLDALDGDERTAFERDLGAAAAGDAAAVSRAVERMIATRAVRASLAQVELLRFRAAKALPVRLTDHPVDHPIRRVIAQLSVL